MTDNVVPRISVLIPVFNGEAFATKSIASALGQSMAPLEVVVIDDASTDGTVKIVRALAEKDARVKLVESTKNGGPGKARTLGLHTARGDWIAILDADDEMEKNRLEVLVTRAEQDSLDAIADNLVLVDPGLCKDVGLAFPIGPDESLELTCESFLDNTRPGGRVNLGWMQPVVRRSFLQERGIEWPEIRHAEDMVFTMRLLMQGARFRLIGQPLYRYTQRRGTKSGTVSGTSRTKRNIAEQLKALETIAKEESATATLSPWARVRLNMMRSEIIATTHALDLRDGLQNSDYRQAFSSALGLATVPFGFWRSVRTRYFRGSKMPPVKIGN